MNFYLYHEVGLVGSNEYTRKFMGVCFLQNCILTTEDMMARRRALVDIRKMAHFMECLKY